MNAKVKLIDGVWVCVGGPNTNTMKLRKGEVHVICSVTADEIPSPAAFYAQVGPTVTVGADANNENPTVNCHYNYVQKAVEQIRAELIAPFAAVFTEIDTRSARAIRAVMVATVAGNTPDAADVETMNTYEQAALDNRAMIAAIKAADFDTLVAGLSTYVPVKPWE